MPKQRRGCAQSLGEPVPPQEQRRSEICHRDGGRLRVGEGTDSSTRSGIHLSVTVLLGVASYAGATGPVSQTGAIGTDTHRAAGPGRETYRRCVACAVSSANAQG